MNEIGRYPLLTKDEEASLAQAIETGHAARQRLLSCDPTTRAGEEDLVRQGEQATTAFIQANLRLVVSVARRYQVGGSAMMDLIQDGNLGLMHAVEKFDWRRGFKFSTYATWWIRQAISRGVATNGRTIRLPAHVGDAVINAYRVRYEMAERHGRSVTTAELARELKMSEDHLCGLLAAASTPRSLSETFGEGNDTDLAERLADKTAVSPAQAAVDATVRGDVETVLGCLGDRERQVLRLRFGLDHGEPRTLDEVGVYFHLTRERIRQIEQRALVKLRHPTVAAHARSLLDS
jgi:RNA polymerase sigma factor (sigma-70 family)